jgi:NAD(P)-dependent dehydrogenase (short-subunit alcohol dehydrogenase family)/acyl carrier protein
MLGLDQNLEADLGIDSIKRVEILGNLAERMYGDGSGVRGRLEMEKLTGLKTFRSIVDYIDNALAPMRDTARPQNASQGERLSHTPAPGTQEYKHLQVQRALIRLIDAPLPASRTLAFPRGIVLFTDDCRGIATEMAGRLTDLGQQAVLLRHDEDAASPELRNLRVDLGNPDAVQALLQHVRKQHGPIAGLIHLLPLAPASAGEAPWRRMQRDVKSLYLLARGLQNDLRQAPGGTLLLAATGLGGGLGFAAPTAPENYFAGHGGVIGFIKCLALEWPESLVRVVDVDVRRAKGDLAQCLLAELTARGGPAEVGHLADRGRVTWAPVAAPIDSGETADPVLSSDSTVLISGGARGITAAVAEEIAKRYRCNLIIIGRSPLPPESEASETAALSTPAEIKSAIIAAMRRDGEAVKVADVEARFNRIAREREMRTSLLRIAQAGGRAHYFQVDVRERDAMIRLLAQIESHFGGLDAVIHGAGVMEDKLIEDKTPDSFDRVFNTKAASALLLSECLNQDRLKLCIFFVSITGRYGNKGQSDYAAANETVSKLALHLDRLWRARVVAVAWGPWSRIGMTADLEKHLTQRGLQMISPEQGPKLLLDELAFGRKGETEVIIARATEDAASREPLMSTMAQGPITELAAAPSA